VAIEDLLDRFSACNLLHLCHSHFFLATNFNGYTSCLFYFCFGNSKVIFKLHLLRSSFKIIMWLVLW